jgi:hypothetical protein
MESGQLEDYGMSDSDEDYGMEFEDEALFTGLGTGSGSGGGRMASGSEAGTSGDKGTTSGESNGIMERLGTQDLFRNWTTTTNVHVQCCGHQIHIG